FSARYRPYAREAFNCVFRRLTLRKCNTSFDKKMKMKISSRLATKNEKLGRVVFKHFEIISWIFTIILFLSLAYSAYSAYNLYMYGTCDPLDPGSCPFTLDMTAVEEAGCNCNFEITDCNSDALTACEGDCDCLKEECEINYSPMGG
ncbi:MAG: hypothetical protein ABH821_03805, partial [archaeon]